jgi:hypothetical protein
MDRLVAAYEKIADEIRAIREDFDQLIDDIGWALNNDKFKPEWFPNLSALANQPTDDPPAASRAENTVTPPSSPVASSNATSATKLVPVLVLGFAAYF